MTRIMSRAALVLTLSFRLQGHCLNHLPRRIMTSSCLASKRVPPNCNLVDFVIGQADKFGNRTALEEAWNGRSYTYSALKSLTLKVAHGLSRQGFGRGEVLCLYASNCLENVPLLFGALAAGGVVHLMLPLAPVEKIAPQLIHCQARYLATTSDREEHVNKVLSEAKTNVSNLVVIETSDSTPSGPNSNVAGRRLTFDDLVYEGDELEGWDTLMSRVGSEDLAVYQLSGGTSGMAKTIMTSHKNLITSQFQAEPVYNLDSDGDETFLAFLPINHSYPINAVYCPALRIGAKVVIMKQFEVDEVLQAVSKHRVTFLHVVPSQLRQILKSPLIGSVDLSSLREILCGAMTVYPQLYNKTMDTFKKFNPNFDFRQGYGMTETSGAVTMMPARIQRTADKPGSVGIVLDNAECQLRPISRSDEQESKNVSSAIEVGQAGELWVRGEQVTRGYLGRPDLTAGALIDGWLRTGDVARFDTDGYLYVTDRVSDVIWCGNSMLLPSTFEGILQTHPMVKECVVLSSGHPELGEVPCAIVIPENDKVTADELVKFVNERITEEHGLHRLKFVECIPKTPVGKPYRLTLKSVLE